MKRLFKGNEIYKTLLLLLLLLELIVIVVVRIDWGLKPCGLRVRCRGDRHGDHRDGRIGNGRRGDGRTGK